MQTPKLYIINVLPTENVTANGSSGALEKNGNDVFLISSIQNPVSVISTIGDIYPKIIHVIVVKV